MYPWIVRLCCLIRNLTLPEKRWEVKKEIKPRKKECHIVVDECLIGVDECLIGVDECLIGVD